MVKTHHTSIAGDIGLIPDQEAKILCVMEHSPQKKMIFFFWSGHSWISVTLEYVDSVPLAVRFSLIF